MFYTLFLKAASHFSHATLNYAWIVSADTLHLKFNNTKVFSLATCSLTYAQYHHKSLYIAAIRQLFKEGVNMKIYHKHLYTHEYFRD